MISVAQNPSDEFFPDSLFCVNLNKGYRKGGLLLAIPLIYGFFSAISQIMNG